MIEFTRKEDSKSPSSPVTPDEGFVRLSPTDREPAAAKIHTMPEKFLPAQTTHGGKRTFLLVIVLVVLVILIAGVGYLLYRSTTETPVVTVNQAPTTNGNQSVNGNSNQAANTNQLINRNGNGNLNSALNGNSNGNGNVNITFLPSFNNNANVNRATSNGNINFNFGVRENAPSSVDTDKDGLTDVEEKLYSTSTTKPDSDSDGYLDGEELVNGYSPLAAGARVGAMATIQSYTNATYQYTVMAPKSWVIQPLSSTNQEVIFSSPEGEFIEILVVDNPNLFSAKSWYLNQFPQASGSQLTSVTIAGQSGIKSLDGFSYYVARGDEIVIITHNIGAKREVDFRSTFQMMVTTLQFVGGAS